MREPEALPARLKRLREERGLSQEGLAFAMYRNGREGATAGAVGQFERGITRPKPETIEALAAALEVPATDFMEYRLALARRWFDERELGLQEAVKNLEAVAGAALDGLDGDLARRMREAWPNAPASQPLRSRRVRKRPPNA